MERLEKGNQICFINEVSFSLGKNCLNFQFKNLGLHVDLIGLIAYW